MALLAWLAAPLRLQCLGQALQAAWRRCTELGVGELALLVEAMREGSALVRAPDSRRLPEGGALLSKERLLLPAELDLLFDVVPNDTREGWSRILQLAADTQEETQERSPGEVPAFYFAPGTTKLFFSADSLLECGEPGKIEDDKTVELPIGQVSRVLARFSKGSFTVFVNGRLTLTGLAKLPAAGRGASLRSGGGAGFVAADASLAGVVCRPTRGGAGLDELLLQKAVRRLRASPSAAYAPLPAAALVQLAEGLTELEAGDEGRDDRPPLGRPGPELRGGRQLPAGPDLRPRPAGGYHHGLGRVGQRIRGVQLRRRLVPRRCWRHDRRGASAGGCLRRGAGHPPGARGRGGRLAVHTCEGTGRSRPRPTRVCSEPGARWAGDDDDDTFSSF